MYIEREDFYIVSNAGRLRIWSIEVSDYDIIIQHGELSGRLQTKVEQVELNQSGRSLEDQTLLRFKSRISNILAKGYCRSIEEAELSKGLNEMKLIKPMLAKKFKDVKDINYSNAWLQYKYNGYRMLVTRVDGKNIAYTRNGKILENVEHIIDGLQLMEGETVDGELYIHGMKLQKIGSLVKKMQKETKHLKYVIYDHISPMKFFFRRGYIKRFEGDNIIVAPSSIAISKNHIRSRFIDALDNGYEGLIIRQGELGYEGGKRSSSLIKVKQAFDEEFLVTKIMSSKDNWAILECVTKSGVVFRVSAPGTIAEKENILANKQDYIGRYVNVEYFEITADRVPFHPVAIYWREENE